ncbi:MAG: PilZ domain-containing protein [Candidatus Omnitrophica bacterium]|nr:PilZ domain-containing protein [Candidatus Omnitrophota bacterium]
MKINVRELKGLTILDVEGRIDIDAAEFIETVGWVLKNNRLKILCNFENVEMVDYSGLSILAIAYKNVANHNGAMKFYNVGMHIRELFRIVQMDRVFQCYDNEQQALLNFDEKILELEMRQLRRRFKRLETNIAVAYTPRKTAGKPARQYTGKVLNLSGAGLFIYGPNILPVRTQLEMEISIPKEMAPFEMKGMVIWIVEKKLQSYCYPGMGVQFVDVDSQKQKELLEFIDKNVTNRSEM